MQHVAVLIFACRAVNSRSKSNSPCGMHVSNCHLVPGLYVGAVQLRPLSLRSSEVEEVQRDVTLYFEGYFLYLPEVVYKQDTVEL